MLVLDDAVGLGRVSSHVKERGGDANAGSARVIMLCGGSGMEEAEGVQQQSFQGTGVGSHWHGHGNGNGVCGCGGRAEE